MKNLIFHIVSLAALSLGASQAQNITGTWQGTLKAGPQELRVVIKISTTENDKLAAMFYSIDQPSPAIPASAFTRDGSNIKMTIAGIITYDGKVSPDGNSIAGTLTQGAPLPLNLTRATPETAWAIPEPPPPPTPMAADAKPGFEVSTIKPARPEGRFSLLVNPRNGMMNTTSTTVADLIKFAYDLHPRQITKGPSWLESEKFDITAKPDTPGLPNGAQLKMMVQKLLTDRFQLTFHKEKKELSVYAITVVKTGPKLTKSTSPLNLPGFGGGPRSFMVQNATMDEFAHVLQGNILEQPVVDQTELGTARYNFVLKWTPDATQSQLGGAGGPGVPPLADGVEAPPDIFLAFQQQLGLKLENTKAPVDVIVIDRLEKPSDN